MPDRMNGFRIPPAQPAPPGDPETLFRNLRHAPGIQFLWSHQSDLLRSYFEQFRSAADVALELPTGTGKTLVGLLLAEWRRLHFRERALYLCPTRQLCHQVGAHAEQYGIRAHVLVGPGDQFPPAAYADYLAADAVAITTYSGIFNYRPRLTDPGTIVLDDAHAAEGYVSSPWTVSVPRWEYPELFAATLDILVPAIPRDVLARVRTDQPDSRLISAIPVQRFWELMQGLRDFFNASEGNDRLPEDVLFPWLMIRDHLDACQIYYSASEIAVRPVVPPTSTHAVFAGARQRIYMSATLGEGGELERIFGVREIGRIPVPRGWERQGSGRRLILFPHRSLDHTQVEALRIDVTNRRGRALIICPSHVVAERLRPQLEDGLPRHRILTARDVERSLDAFTEENRAVLLLAGRYDGIDLPDDACRVLVVHGLPAGITLQERFLSERLGATALLRDRIRTRLSQAMGRCTRNANDFAVVLLEGEHLLDFCANPETRRGLHPELQAEMEFGLQNSERRPSPEAFVDLMEIFFRRGDGWDQAEQALTQLREGRERQVGTATTMLQEVVASEIAYVEALWHGAYDQALAAARHVAERLTGPELASYRAWWYYLAGTAAWLLFKQSDRPDYRDMAADHWYRARQAAPSSWFREVEVPQPAAGAAPGGELSLAASRAIELATEYLIDAGLVGARFERELQELHELLSQTASAPFERGLQKLGTILGWSARRPDEQGAPDSVWQLPGLCLVFEAKTDEVPEAPISRTATQQAAGHARWAEARLTLQERTQIVIVLVSPRTQLAAAAGPHVDSVFVVAPGAIREIADEAMAAAREVRGTAAPGEPLLAQMKFSEVFRRSGLLPEDVVLRLTARSLRSLPVA